MNRGDMTHVILLSGTKENSKTIYLICKVISFTGPVSIKGRAIIDNLSHYFRCEDCATAGKKENESTRRELIVYFFVFQSSLAVYVKIKLPLCLTKHHVTNAYWGSGDIAPLIL
jgi:hypothetical protein